MPAAPATLLRPPDTPRRFRQHAERYKDMRAAAGAYVVRRRYRGEPAAAFHSLCHDAAYAAPRTPIILLSFAAAPELPADEATLPLLLPYEMLCRDSSRREKTEKMRKVQRGYA